MQVSKSSQYALSICVAVGLLVGCESATNVTPPQNNGVSLNSSRALHTVAYGLEAKRPYTERLKGSGIGPGGGSCNGGLVVIVAKGIAGGPYPGTFTGKGNAPRLCTGGGFYEFFSR
jgi:hypothetical protein